MKSRYLAARLTPSQLFHVRQAVAAQMRANPIMNADAAARAAAKVEEGESDDCGPMRYGCAAALAVIEQVAVRDETDIRHMDDVPGEQVAG
jgi:hypothetical protein